MLRLNVRSTVLPLVAAALLGACSDPSAPAPRVLAAAPASAVVGGPNLSDFNSFAGWLWVCPDTPVGGTAGFYFSWKITDNATNVVVGQGTVMNASAQQCLNLGNVSTTAHGRYTATVKEDPGQPYHVTGITADYGSNFPGTPPTPMVNLSKNRISSLITNDFGVVFTFHH
jgi:hypothetical protein